MHLFHKGKKKEHSAMKHELHFWDFIAHNADQFMEAGTEWTFSLRRLLFYGLLSLIIGVLVGIVDTIFGRILFLITDFREEYFHYLIPFLGLGGVLLMWVYINYAGKARKGMSLVFDVGYENERRIPFRLVPLSIFGTWITHLFGGSAGREGVAVQIGATVGTAFQRFLPKGEHTRVLLLSGMAAGFGGLFGTPMAGTIFALEVLVVGSIFYEALVPALIAAFTASFTSSALGLQHMRVPLNYVPDLNPHTVGYVIIAGLAFGLVGRAFVWSIYTLRYQFAKWIHNPMLRIFVIGSILAVGLYFIGDGRYAGLSDNLLMAPFIGDEIDWWDWALKFVFTVVTLSCGFQGGELAPIFVIGATLGAVIGFAFGLSAPFLAAIGCAAVFGSATHTMFAPMFIGVEVFGPDAIPYFFIACVAAFVVSGKNSIYGSQKKLQQLINLHPENEADVN